MTTRPQLLGIQAARGIAALLVVAFHMTGISERFWHEPFAGGIFAFGWSGVDLFFVLSGFIIVFIHGKDVGSVRLDRLRPYARRRFVRIYPVYAILTLAVLPIYFVIGEPGKQELGVIVRSFLLLPQRIGQPPIITVGWSLSFEALFYLVFGLMIALPRRAAMALFGVWMALTLAVAVTTAVSGPWFLHAYATSWAFLLEPRNLEFGLGCACGWSLARARSAGAGAALLAAGVGGFLAFGLNEVFLWVPSSAGLRLAGFGLSSAAIVAGVSRLDLARAWRVPRFLAHCGDASYSIYLTHGLVLTMLVVGGRRIGLPVWLGAVPAQLVVLAGTVAIGVGIYRVLERPILDRLRDGAAARRTPAIEAKPGALTPST